MELKIWAIFLVLISASECSRILFLYPTISKSQDILLQPLAEKLAKKGHEVTYISPFPIDKPVKNYRSIPIPYDENDKKFISDIIKEPKGKGLFYTFQRLTGIIYKLGNETLQMKELRKLMDEEQFDLVVVGFFLTDFMFGIADHFKCPSIMFNPVSTTGMINQILGNPLEVSSVPHFLLGSVEMNFVNRVKNFLITGVEMFATQYFKYRARQVYDFNFPSDRYISYNQALNNISLILVNSHFSTGGIKPNLPNMVEVGGLKTNSKTGPMPEKLQKFLDGAKDGAIFFSLGSNVKSSFLQKETVKILFSVFSKIKQRVVVTWESEVVDEKPENVYLSKWNPQDEILSHPNTKAFISHCGLGSVVESKYHGVPIIGIPLVGDQPTNIEKIVKEGWAIKLSLQTLTEQELLDSIYEIISNSKYRDTVKRMAEFVIDRPMPALETAVFWTEYVLRHRGAPHLHYAGADLNWFQYNSLDVIIFLILMPYFTFKLLIFAIKKLCCKKKTTEQVVKSKKSAKKTN